MQKLEGEGEGDKGAKARVGEIIRDIIELALVSSRRVETRRQVHYWVASDGGYDSYGPKNDETDNEIVVDLIARPFPESTMYDEYAFSLQFQFSHSKNLVVNVQKNGRLIVDHTMVDISGLYEDYPRLYDLITIYP